MIFIIYIFYYTELYPRVYLVGGFKHFLFSIIYGMSSFPLTNSIIFKMVIAPPTSYDEIYILENIFLDKYTQQFMVIVPYFSRWLLLLTHSSLMVTASCFAGDLLIFAESMMKFSMIFPLGEIQNPRLGKGWITLWLWHSQFAMGNHHRNRWFTY